MNKLKKSLVIVNRFKPNLIDQHFKRMKIDSMFDYKITEGEKFDPYTFKGEAEQLTVLWASKQQVIEALQKNPNIKWIHSLLAGVDGIISPELVNHPAQLTNAKGAYSESLGEWAIFCMLWQSKRLNNWFKLKQQGKWQPSEVGYAKDQTLGIIGYGDIGVECAKHVKGAFNSRVIAMKKDTTTVTKDGKKYVDELIGNDRLDYLLKNSDVVINCTPLTPETKGLCNKDFFKKMRKTATFVNVGRGPSVVEDDLAEAIKTGTISGAILDVFEVEPLKETSPLWGLDNVFITPHCADLTHDYFERSFDIFGQNLKNWVNNKPLINIVNKKAGY
jgi:phosphoglycerate dehydrogenase-like enzyme